jgi:hypothetical protein
MATHEDVYEIVRHLLTRHKVMYLELKRQEDYQSIKYWEDRIGSPELIPKLVIDRIKFIENQIKYHGFRISYDPYPIWSLTHSVHIEGTEYEHQQYPILCRTINQEYSKRLFNPKNLGFIYDFFKIDENTQEMGEHRIHDLDIGIDFNLNTRTYRKK